MYVWDVDLFVSLYDNLRYAGYGFTSGNYTPYKIRDYSWNFEKFIFFFSNEAWANDLNAFLEFPPRVRSLRCSHATGTNRSVVDSSPIINFGRRECSGNSHSSFPFPFAVLAKKRSVAREEMCPLDARNLSLVAFFFDVLRWFDVEKKNELPIYQKKKKIWKFMMKFRQNFQRPI